MFQLFNIWTRPVQLSRERVVCRAASGWSRAQVIITKRSWSLTDFAPFFSASSHHAGYCTALTTLATRRDLSIDSTPVTMVHTAVVGEPYSQGILNHDE